MRHPLWIERRQVGCKLPGGSVGNAYLVDMEVSETEVSAIWMHLGLILAHVRGLAQRLDSKRVGSFVEVISCDWLCAGTWQAFLHCLGESQLAIDGDRLLQIR